MPNTPSTRPGKSLKERLETARRMTAEQQRAIREEEPLARRPRRESAEKPKRKSSGDDSGKKPARQSKSSSKRSSGPTTRTASKEEIEMAKRQRKAPSLPSISLSTGAKVAIGAVVIVVLAMLILYPVGQRYYQTMRDAQRDEAWLAAVEERNKTVEEQNKALETDEGVENTARSELGWTKEGEAAAVVTNAGDSDSGSSALPDQVDPEQIKAPSTWYYSILDVVFLYQPDVPSETAQQDQESADSQESEKGEDAETDKK